MLNYLIFLLFVIMPHAWGQEFTNAQNQFLNENILREPGFETGRSAWTVSGGTATLTTTAIKGKRALQVVSSAQTLSIKQSSTLYAAEFAKGAGVQGAAFGQALITSYTSGNLFLCPVRAGVSVTSNFASQCAQINTGSTGWQPLKVPYTLGGTSNGLEILSDGAWTGTVIVDEFYLTAGPITADVDQSRFFGGLKYPGGPLCSWQTTSTVISDFAADTDCSAPTISGRGLAPGTKVPQIDLGGMTPGKEYLVIAKFTGEKSVNTASGAYFWLTDGSNNPIDKRYQFVAGAVNSAPFTLSGRFVATGSSASFKIRASAESAGTAAIQNLSSQFELEFLVYEFRDGSVYTSNNADTDWSDCGLTTGDFNGLGTVTGIEDLCKRQGSDLLMQVKFTAGTVTGAEVRANLRLGGVSLTSANASIIPSIRKVGHAARGPSESADNFHVLIEPTVTYVTFSRGATGNSGIAKVLGTTLGNGDTLSFEARVPINGWNNSNLIIGQFNGLERCTDSYECTDIFSANVSSVGTVAKESLEFINGNCTKPITGRSVCSFNTGVYTVAPNCIAQADNSSAASQISCTTNGNISNTSVQVDCKSGAADSNQPFILFCQKQGVDAIGKTAKAVASDQNDRTPGLTDKVTYYADITGAGVVTEINGDWLNGNCSGSGAYACTVNTGIFAAKPYHCEVNPYANSTTKGTYDYAASSLPTLNYAIRRMSNEVVTAVNHILKCEGIAP